MEQMRERVARAIANATVSGPFGLETDPSDYYEEADAALSLMQPEIDRRVAEEKARLAKAAKYALVRYDSLDGSDASHCNLVDAMQRLRAMLAQYEKEQQP